MSKSKQDFTHLIIWQISHQLVLKVYELTKTFPSEEKFGLTNQLRRAIASIPSNICEGFGRKSPKEFKQFLYISLGSLEESRYQLLLSRDLSFISNDQYTFIENKLNVLRINILSFIKQLS